jgi:hypothetical protein
MIVTVFRLGTAVFIVDEHGTTYKVEIPYPGGFPFITDVGFQPYGVLNGTHNPRQGTTP